MDEIKERNDDIDDNNLLFIGSNKEIFNFNRMPLNFPSAIYNCEISLKETEFKQKDLEEKIAGLKSYRNNVEKEKKKKQMQY